MISQVLFNISPNTVPFNPSLISLFTKTQRNSFMILLVYVDDVILAGSNEAAITDLKVSLNDFFFFFNSKT